MAHISLKEGLPGIRSLFEFRPETAKPITDLAQILLHEPGPLSLGERELIAAYVSRRNDCFFCHTSHGAIAGKVQQGGKQVTPEDVEVARSAGASDLEIHDTVLIAAMFCMCNRYVDGLGTWAPTDMDSYRARAASVARNDYGHILSQIQTGANAG